MRRSFCFLFVVIVFLSGSRSAWAENDFDFDFDDSEFDDVVFEEESDSSSNWFMENLRLELGHNLTSSRNLDWDFMGNKTSATVGWTKSISPSLYTELEGQLDLYWGEDISASDDFDTRFTDAYIQASVANISSKLGYFTLGWGEVEGSQVLDVINPTASITSGSMDISGASQLFLSTDIYMGAKTGSLFINIDPQVAEFPIPGVSTKKTNELEFGGQLKVTMAGSDVSYYLAYLLPNTPVLNQATNEAEANPYTLIGSSMNRSFGKMLLKADVAYKQGLDIIDSTLMTGPASIDRLDYGIGIEYGFSDGKQLVVAVNNKQTLNFKDSFFIIPGFEAKKHVAQLMVSFSETYLNDNLSLDAGGLTSLDAEMIMLFNQLDYSLSDRWSVNSGLVFAYADNDSLFASYDQEIMISVGAIWSN